MLKIPPYILPLLLTTLLVAGGIEGIAWQLKTYFTSEKRVFAEKTSITPSTVQSKETKNISQKQVLAQQKQVIINRQLFGSSPASLADQNKLDLPAITAKDLQVVLMGTIGVGSGDSRAIIMDKSDKSQNIYKEGDTILGTQIKEILRQRVILSIDGQDKILEMNEAMSYAPKIEPAKQQKQVVPKAKKTRRVINSSQ